MGEVSPFLRLRRNFKSSCLWDDLGQLPAPIQRGFICTNLCMGLRRHFRHFWDMVDILSPQ